MDTKKLKEHLITLSQLTGPSGHEGDVRAYVRETWADLVDEFEVDGLGSLVAIKRGTGQEPRKRIMLSAHMDEIGLMVAEIKNGYLRLERVGGMDSRIMLSKPVLVHTREKTLKGVVATPPPHITNQTGGKKDYLPFDQQWIDLGLPAEAVDKMVRIGDLVTMDAPVTELMGDLLATKAMDDRASVAAVTACLQHLKPRDHNWDVHAVASVQEEVGLKGAATAAYHTRPDLAIAIDVGFAQQPGVSGDEHIKPTEGPLIGIGPNFHNGLVADMQRKAKELEMTLVVEPTPGRSGTDAWAIQVSRQGVPTILFSIPIRNMHSPVETVSVKTVERTGRLMAEFISGLADDYLDAIAWKPDEETENHANGDDA
ncbi:MAG: M42 family metallopeptidase [Chloroflexi bacterium]|nr:M42 family metallopeptidase [Chloroflexota bacterium]